MKYANQAGDSAAFENAFSSVKNPNYQELYFKSVSCVQNEDYTQAAEYALMCIEKSPYWEDGYNLLEQITEQLGGAERTRYLDKAGQIREFARENAHIFSDYLVQTGK
jgi:hypothetical protein